MGKGVADYSAECEEIYKTGSRVLGLDAEELSVKGKAAEVTEPSVTFQLQMLHNIALVKAAEDILPAPEAYIGYSAGELSAVTAGGVLSTEDGISAGYAYRDVRQEAVKAGELITYRLRNVKQEFVSLASDKCMAGFVQMTAVEAPEQTVIIGDEDGMKTVLTELAKHKVQPTKLKDSLPLHSMMVFPYVVKLQDAMRGFEHGELKTPLYSTLYGKKVDNMNLPADYFAKQQVNATRFYEAANAAVKDGIGCFIILGKDKALQTALKNIAGEQNVFIAETPDDLKKIAEKLK